MVHVVTIVLSRFNGKNKKFDYVSPISSSRNKHLTSVVMGRPRTKPQMQLKKVIVVSHDLRAEVLIAMIPVMTQCQIHSCKHTTL
jgi:hypothetical protein